MVRSIGTRAGLRSGLTPPAEPSRPERLDERIHPVAGAKRVGAPGTGRPLSTFSPKRRAPHGVTLIGRLFDEGTIGRAGIALERRDILHHVSFVCFDTVVYEAYRKLIAQPGRARFR